MGGSTFYNMQMSDHLAREVVEEIRDVRTSVPVLTEDM